MKKYVIELQKNSTLRDQAFKKNLFNRAKKQQTRNDQKAAAEVRSKNKRYVPNKNYDYF